MAKDEDAVWIISLSMRSMSANSRVWTSTGVIGRTVVERETAGEDRVGGRLRVDCDCCCCCCCNLRVHEFRYLLTSLCRNLGLQDFNCRVTIWITHSHKLNGNSREQQIHFTTVDQSIVREGERRRAHSDTCSEVTLEGGRESFELEGTRARMVLELGMMKGPRRRDTTVVLRIEEAKSWRRQ